MECSIAANWTIDESCLRETGQSDYIQHKFIETTFPEIEFALRVYPNGYDASGNGVFFSLFLKKCNNIYANFTVTIPSTKMVKTIATSDSEKLSGFLCSRSIFFDPKYKFIKNGKFFIQLRGILKNDGRKSKNPLWNAPVRILQPETEFIIEVHETCNSMQMKVVHEIVLKKYSDIFENCKS